MDEQPEKRLTSAEIKKQIEDMQASQKADKMKEDLKNSGLPLTGGLANEINALGSTTEVKPKAESKPQPETPAAETESAKSDALKEWAKKKGIDWTTEESVLAALRKSDQQFHQKRELDRTKEAAERPPAAPAWTPQPPFNPYAPNGFAPPAYAAPNRQLVENLARQYRMLPEDFERVAQLNNDLFQSMMAQERQRQAKEWESIKNENTKNSVFRDLATDPVFRSPEVGMEFHNVMEEMQARDPESFEKDPHQYRVAFDKALANIGRRNLEGRTGTNPAQFTPPSTPPAPLGSASGHGSLQNESEMTPQRWQKMSVQEQREWFESRGLVQSY